LPAPLPTAASQIRPPSTGKVPLKADAEFGNFETATYDHSMTCLSEPLDELANNNGLPQSPA
jgi:hypothetical protein